MGDVKKTKDITWSRVPLSGVAPAEHHGANARETCTIFSSTRVVPASWWGSGNLGLHPLIYTSKQVKRLNFSVTTFHVFVSSVSYDWIQTTHVQIKAYLPNQYLCHV